MSKPNDSAFPQIQSSGEDPSRVSPVAKVWSEGGLTKRELFAMAAMQGLMRMEPTNPKEASRLAVMHADALLTELAKERAE